MDHGQCLEIFNRFFKLFRRLGTLPLRVDKNCDVAFSFLGFVLSLFVTVYFIAAAYVLTYSFDLERYLLNAPAYTETYMILSNVNIIILPIHLITVVRKMKCFGKLLHFFLKLDQKVETNTKFDYNALIMINLFVPVLTFSSVINGDTIFNAVFHSSTAILNNTILLQATRIIFYIGRFLRSLTLSLEICTKDVKIIENHLVTYNDILAAVHLVNDIYGIQLLLLFLQKFLAITIFIYWIFQWWNYSSVYKIVLITLVATQVFVVGNIIRACGLVAKAANEFNDALYRTIMADRHDVFNRNFKVSAHLANKKTAVFTACGWFNIDYTTSCSMIATSATYLIILLQMGGTDLNHSNPSNQMSLNQSTKVN